MKSRFVAVWIVAMVAAVLTATHYFGEPTDFLGAIILLASGMVFVARGMYGTGAVMMAVALWLLLTANAHAAGCSDVRGYWTIAEDGPSEHERGGNTIELRRPNLGPGYDWIDMQLHLDPAATWEGCARIGFTMTYKAAMTDGQGVPQIAVYGFGNHENDLTGWMGKPGYMEGAWFGELAGPGGVSFGGWLNGTMAGYLHASLHSQWIVAPGRLPPHTKRNIRTIVTTLDNVGDVTVGTSSLIPNKLLAKTIGLAGAAMKASAKWQRQALDADPWDANYKTIFVATLPPVPDYVRGDLYIAWIRNMFLIRKTSRELAVAMDRANTAMAMEDSTAEGKQQDRIEALLAKLAKLYAKEIALRERVGAKSGVDVVTDPTLLAAFADQAA
jgi:hypothetical protein